MKNMITQKMRSTNWKAVGMAAAKHLAVFSLAFAAAIAISGVPVFADSQGLSSEDLDSVTDPIIALIKSFVGPLLGLVGAAGTIYCILLGVKFATAEEPQEREKRKAALRNAIIGFVLIFVLVVALTQLIGPLETWMTNNMAN